MRRREAFFSLMALTSWSWASVAQAGPFGLFGKEETPKKSLKWQTDLKAAHKLSQEQDKPMLVVFGADWCTYCKKLEKETLSHPDLVEYITEGFIPVHLDADKDQRVVEILKVQGLPCSVVLSPAADEILRIDGYLQPSGYFQKLTTAKQQYQKVQALQAAPATP